MDLNDYLAIPYVLTVEAVADDRGNWICRLSYDELPGCVARAVSPLDALDELETLKEAYIAERLQRGLPVPVPREPLST